MRIQIGLGILAVISLVGVSLSPAQAQGPATTKGKSAEKGGQPGARGRMGGGIMRSPKIIKELGLTEAQQKQVTAIMEKSIAKRKTLREDKALTDDQRRTKMRELGKETNTALEKVLTPEQNTKVKAMRKKMMEERAAKGGNVAKSGKIGAKP